MIRKLVKQGPSTLTVSLPKEWIDRFELKNGDEIEMEDAKTLLILSNRKNKKKFSETTTYDLKGIDPLIINTLITGMYRAGLRDVDLTNLSPEASKTVDRILKDCMGFEKLESTKSSINISDLGTFDEESLNKAENQIYWKLMNLVDEFANPKSTHESLKEMDYEINRLAFFIQRNLMSNYPKDSRSFIIYEKISSLENLGDILAVKETGKKRGIKEETAEAIKQVIDGFRAIQVKRDLNRFIKLKRDLEKLKKDGSISAIWEKLNDILQTNMALYVREFSIQ